MDEGSIAFSVALLAGYLAIVVLIVVPGSHWCHDEKCVRLVKERKGDIPK